MKYAVLHDFKLGGLFCVTFAEIRGNTEGLSFRCYPTKHEALLEKSIFENAEIFKKLAKM